MTDLAALRRAYARKTLDLGGVESPRLEDAFAAVPREDFVGPGPWRLLGSDLSELTPDADPARLYDNVLVVLVADKQINNGQPSGHAAWLAAADPQPGEHAVHIGAGTGYYTAILAELVGPTGRVTAIEYDESLARRAAGNLAPRANVQVIHGDGVKHPFAPADVIYVNAGATHPADAWLHGLKQGGRLIIPLTTTGLDSPFPVGAMFRFTRRGEEFAVSIVSQAAFISCEGLRTEASDRALAQAFSGGDAGQVTRLVRDGDWPENQVWLRWPGWALLKGN